MPRIIIPVESADEAKRILAMVYYADAAACYTRRDTVVYGAVVTAIWDTMEGEVTITSAVLSSAYSLRDFVGIPAKYHVVCMASRLFDAPQFPRIVAEYDTVVRAEAEVRQREMESDEYRYTLASEDEEGRLIDHYTGDVIELANA